MLKFEKSEFEAKNQFFWTFFILDFLSEADTGGIFCYLGSFVIGPFKKKERKKEKKKERKKERKTDS